MRFRPLRSTVVPETGNRVVSTPPPTMKAVVYDRPGPADVLHVAEVPVPTPVLSEVLVRVGWTAGGGQYIAVKDNGPGIPEEERERATERFVRLEQSRTQPGSGLGLSLAKAVMEFHRGRLELSGRNPGLSVRMIFPGDSRKDEQG